MVREVDNVLFVPKRFDSNEESLFSDHHHFKEIFVDTKKCGTSYIV